jgi:hypothetical protein
MNVTLFETLIKSPESAVLDFKSAAFDFSGNKETEEAKLIKDILSFVNTIRDETACIFMALPMKTAKIHSLVSQPFRMMQYCSRKSKTKLPLFPNLNLIPIITIVLISVL